MVVVIMTTIFFNRKTNMSNKSKWLYNYVLDQHELFISDNLSLILARIGKDKYSSKIKFDVKYFGKNKSLVESKDLARSELLKLKIEIDNFLLNDIEPKIDIFG